MPTWKYIHLLITSKCLMDNKIIHHFMFQVRFLFSGYVRFQMPGKSRLTSTHNRAVVALEGVWIIVHLQNIRILLSSSRSPQCSQTTLTWCFRECSANESLFLNIPLHTLHLSPESSLICAFLTWCFKSWALYNSLSQGVHGTLGWAI